jgi:acetyl esterase/lipase
MPGPSRVRLSAVLVATLFLAADTIQAADKSVAVKTYQDIVYSGVSNDPDKECHELDIYRPKGKSGCPVLFFVHGGAWVSGCKDKVLSVFGYSNVAESFVQHGIVVVMPNYRLSPGVKHPEHIKDVARAFAWTCQHIDRYGGDPDRIFVGGHSAGGHLVALLATDPTWLKAEGRSQKDIQGVIGVSGVYKLEDIDLDLKISIKGPKNSFKWEAEARPMVLAFGKDPDVLKQASPITHVHSGLPPFLLLNGGLDFSPLKRMSKDFSAALKDVGCEVQTKTISWRTHDTLLFDIIHQRADRKMADAAVDFMERQPRVARGSR